MSYNDGVPAPAQAELPGYPTTTVARLTGLSVRQLDYLANKGVLRPSLADASGSGTRRRYSFDDLIALKTIGALRDAGVSLAAVRNVVSFLRSRGLAAPLAEARLLVEGHDVLWLETDQDVVSLLGRPSQQALRFVVDVGMVVSELRRQVAREQGPLAVDSAPAATA
jgi:DNA-binding transcriptional MerR regulator